MSGIYIKGMEMPDRCFSCPLNDTDCCGISKGAYIEYREVDVDVAINGRPDWCPLIPAADVREVKRGHWVKAKGSWCTPGGDPVWECSECSKGRHVYGIEHGTYGADIADGQWVSCPNCGADMREEQT